MTKNLVGKVLQSLSDNYLDDVISIMVIRINDYGLRKYLEKLIDAISRHQQIIIPFFHRVAISIKSYFIKKCLEFIRLCWHNKFPSFPKLRYSFRFDIHHFKISRKGQWKVIHIQFTKLFTYTQYTDGSVVLPPISENFTGYPTSRWAPRKRKCLSNLIAYKFP